MKDFAVERFADDSVLLEIVGKWYAGKSIANSEGAWLSFLPPAN